MLKKPRKHGFYFRPYFVKLKSQKHAQTSFKQDFEARLTQQTPNHHD